MQTNKFFKAHLTFRDEAKNLCFQKIQSAMLKDTILVTQVTNDRVKRKIIELTITDLKQPIIRVMKSYTEAMTFLGHDN